MKNIIYSQIVTSCFELITRHLITDTIHNLLDLVLETLEQNK